MYKKKDQVLKLSVCVLDAVAVTVSLILAGLLRYRSFDQLLTAESFQTLWGTLMLSHVVIFYSRNIFDGLFARNRYLELKESVLYNVYLALVATVAGFCLKMPVFTSRLMFGYFCIVNVVMIFCAHVFVRNLNWLLQKNAQKQSNLLVVTTAEHLPKIVQRFSTSKERAWKIVGVLLLGDQRLPEGLENLHQIPAREDAYLEFAVQHVVDEVFIQIDDIQRQESYLKNMILMFERMGVTVNLNLDLFELGLGGERHISKLEKYNVVTFASRLFDYRMVLIKRLIDIVGAIVGLMITFLVGIFLAPVLLLESPGPLIFKQNRVGVNGRIFSFYKFRSMYVDAEARKKELMAQNEMKGLMFKMENDPRITKVGAFIRKTSIDELPQFWNVLKGDMSLVGTRPPTVDEYEQYNVYQKRRISFRPGITGLWQISGRSDIKDFDEVVKLDLEYIDNWSLGLDFRILVKTVLIVLKGKGAE